MLQGWWIQSNERGAVLLWVVARKTRQDKEEEMEMVGFGVVEEEEEERKGGEEVR